MGAMPVFYLAPNVGGKTDFAGASVSLLHRLKEMHSLFERLHSFKNECTKNRVQGPLLLRVGSNNREISIRASSDGVLDVIAALEYELRDADTLRAAIDSLSGLMYPSEYSNDELLDYFQEKEWRITNSMVHAATGKGLSHDLSTEHKEYLSRLDPGYFQAEIEMKSKSGPVVDFCCVISEFDGSKIIDLCSRIVVPENMSEKVKMLLPEQIEKIVSLESCRSL